MTSYERLRRIRNQHQQKRVDAILREFREERDRRLAGRPPKLVRYTESGEWVRW